MALIAPEVVAHHAGRLHDSAVVVDGHCDILRPALAGISNLATPWTPAEAERWKILAEQTVLGTEEANSIYQIDTLSHLTAPAGQYELSLLRAGGVTAQCAAIYLGEEQLDTALATALEMVVCLSRHITAHSESCLLATEAAHIAQAKAQSKAAYILTMEGAEPLGRRGDLLEAFYLLGLRMTTLTHSRRNAFADGTQLNVRTGGLTQAGRKLIKGCEDLGVTIDLAHLADTGFWETIELTQHPVLCSHTSLLTETPGYRAPWDETNSTYGVSKIQAIACTGGLVGVMFYGMDDVERVAAEIAHGIELVGSSHIGIGSDLFGFPNAPRELENMGKLRNLTEALIRTGLQDQDIEAVLGGNFLRVFAATWKT